MIATRLILVPGTLQAKAVLQVQWIAERPMGRERLCLKGLWAFWTLNALRSVLRQQSHGTERARLLASQGRGLLTSCGATRSPRPSAHQAPLSASKSTAGFDHALESQKVYPKPVYDEKFWNQKMVFEKSPQPHFRDPELCVTSASTGSASTLHLSWQWRCFSFNSNWTGNHCGVACPAPSIHQLVMNAVRNL